MADKPPVPRKPSGVPPPPPPRTAPAQITSSPPPPPPASSPPPPPPQTAATQSAPAAPPTPPPPPPPPADKDEELADLLDRLHAEIDTETSTENVEIGAPLTRPTDASRPARENKAVESDGGLDFRPVFASYGARFGGLVIDSLILLLWMIPGIILMASGSVGFIILGLVISIAGFSAATVTYARGISTSGQSVGNRVMSTKVVDARNGRLISAGNAGVRFVIRQVVSMIFFIGFLMALGNSQRRTFHDDVAGTVVTRPQRASWSLDDEPTADAES